MRSFHDFAAFVQFMPQGVIIAKQDTSAFVYANGNALDVLGYELSELLGKTPAHIHPEDEMQRVMLAFQAMIAGKINEIKHIRFLTKSGHIVIQNIKAFRIEDDGETYVCGLFEKVLEADELIRRSEEVLAYKEQLATAQEVAKLGFWTLYHQAGKLQWSDPVYAIFDIDASDTALDFETFLAFVAPGDRERLQTAFAKHLEERVPYDIVHRIETKDGKVKYLREQCKTSFDADDLPIFSFGTVIDVTELELARQKAVGNWQRLNEILVNSKSYYWELDLDGTFTYLSDNVNDILGYEPEEMAGKSMAFFHPEEGRSDFEQALGDLIRKKKSISELYNPVQRKDGAIIWVSTNGLPKYDHAGTLVGFHGSDTEITERRLAEVSLKASELKFRTIAETLPDAIWIADLDFKMTYASPAVQRILGYTPEEFIHQDRAERFTSSGLVQVKTYMERQLSLLKAGKFERDGSWKLEVEAVQKNGASLWVRIHTAVLLDEEGRPIGFLGIMSDISVLRERENRLQEMNAFLEKAGDLSKLGVWEYDLSTNTLFWNKVLRDLHEVEESFALNVEEAIRFYLPEYRGIIQKHFEDILQNGGAYDVELQIETAKGNVRWVRTMGTADEVDGVLSRVWGVFQDIDERKKNEQALVMERKRLVNVITATQVATWFWNVQTGEAIFDARWAEIIGHELVDLEPVSGDTWEKYTHPDDLQTAREKLESYFSGLSALYEAEFRMQHKNGHWIWIRSVGSVIERTEDGKPLHMYGTFEDIHESVRIRQDLAEKETRLQLITENLNEVFWLRDPSNTVMLYLSPSFEHVFGMKVDEVMKRPERWMEAVVAADKEMVQEAYMDYMRGADFNLRYHVNGPDGKVICVHVRTKPAYDRAGELIGHAGVATDVTEQEGLMIELREAEEKYRIIAENNYNWEFWQGPAGDYIYHSPSSERITGLKASALQGAPLSFLQLILPEDKPAYLSHERKARQGNRIQLHLFRIKNKAGHIRLIEQVCQPLYDEKGSYIGLRGTNIDVTDKKESEFQLRKLWKAMEQTKASVVITDVAGNIEYVNPFFSELTGYSLSEVIGKNPKILSSGATNKEEYIAMWDLLSSGKTWHGEFLNKKKNGDYYWESATISPILGEDDRVLNYVAIKEDVTAKKADALRLLQSESRYRLIAENTSDVIWVYNFQHKKFTFVSPSIAYLRGLTVKEAMNESLEHTLSKHHFASINSKLLAQEVLLQSGEPIALSPQVIEIQQPHKDGYLVWTEISLQYNKNELGEIEIIGISRDINERKAAERHRQKIKEALEESEERFRTLFYENASPMYLVDDETGKIQDANQAALDFYGCSRATFIGRSIKDINHSSPTWSMVRKHLQKYMVGRFEGQHKRKDGSLVDVEIFSCLLQITGRKVVHEIVHDISDRNKYMVEIKKQNEMLKQIAWTQSHEVRAPLARLMSLIELVQLEQTSIYSESFLLEGISKSAYELDAIVHEITQRIRDLQKVSSVTKTDTLDS